MAIIYKIQNTINHKFYLGSTINKKIRFARHINSLYNGIHHSKKLQNAWNKYGEDNFVFIIIEDNIDNNDIKNKEQYYLDNLMPYKYGYNISDSANGWTIGKKHTEETKIKIGNKNRGRIFSVATRLKMRISHLGIQNTEETKKKISFKNKGRKCTEEAKKKIGLKNKGRKHTEETKLKWINRKNPMLGRKGISNPNSISILQYKNDQFIKEWSSAAEASEKLGLYSTSITACCKGRLKTTGSFIWKYKS